MADNDDLRASHADRDQTVSLLQQHYQAGRLTVTELEERTGKALAARTLGDLRALLADLPAESAPFAAPQEWPSQCTPWPAPFARRIGALAATAIGLTFIWLIGGHHYYWPIWPIFGCFWILATPRRGRARRRRLLSRGQG